MEAITRRQALKMLHAIKPKTSRAIEYRAAAIKHFKNHMPHDAVLWLKTVNPGETFIENGKVVDPELLDREKGFGEVPVPVMIVVGDNSAYVIQPERGETNTTIRNIRHPGDIAGLYEHYAAEAGAYIKAKLGEIIRRLGDWTLKADDKINNPLRLIAVPSKFIQPGSPLSLMAAKDTEQTPTIMPVVPGQKLTNFTFGNLLPVPERLRKKTVLVANLHVTDSMKKTARGVASWFKAGAYMCPSFFTSHKKHIERLAYSDGIDLTQIPHKGGGNYQSEKMIAMNIMWEKIFAAYKAGKCTYAVISGTEAREGWVRNKNKFGDDFKVAIFQKTVQGAATLTDELAQESAIVRSDSSRFKTDVEPDGVIAPIFAAEFYKNEIKTNPIRSLFKKVVRPITGNKRYPVGIIGGAGNTGLAYCKAFDRIGVKYLYQDMAPTEELPRNIYERTLADLAIKCDRLVIAPTTDIISGIDLQTLTGEKQSWLSRLLEGKRELKLFNLASDDIAVASLKSSQQAQYKDSNNPYSDITLDLQNIKITLARAGGTWNLMDPDGKELEGELIQITRAEWVLGIRQCLQLLENSETGDWALDTIGEGAIGKEFRRMLDAGEIRLETGIFDPAKAEDIKQGLVTTLEKYGKPNAPYTEITTRPLNPAEKISQQISPKPRRPQILKSDQDQTVWAPHLKAV
jgi:hypothetical protein